MLKKNLSIVLSFCAVNFLLFAGYRLIFLQKFSDNASISDTLSILVSGMRLDFALLFFEIFLVLCAALLIGRFYLRFSFLSLWTLTFLHSLFSFANILFFQERNQNLGESFIAYITSPYKIYIATAPFIKENYIFEEISEILTLS